ncbi:hypothetical protein [Amycolatopsis sp. Hca4]|uniref:hypothetical protein n=1 Tax=Amycolatopsis sp. Hca4 TaxID=2742131 RepID=UPI0020CB07AA|nr:hypothetical protein [Amycolatopsis sp. Hca4]
MAVRYVRVDPIVNLFAPATRAFGTIAVVGRTSSTAAVIAKPVLFTNPDDAKDAFPGELGTAIELAFLQTPGPELVFGVPVASTAPDWAAGLDAVAALNVQLVLLANVPVTDTTKADGGPIHLLSDHVTSVSNTGADGSERMGVAMLEKGETDPGVILPNERMVYIAHNSTQDAAAAVAGTIAGYEPSVSLLLKPVNITSPPFRPADIETLNGPQPETAKTGPTGAGVNWLTTPALIPGNGVFMGEGYTGDSSHGKKYIDVVRFTDDVAFQLKARLINSIGNVRITRSGLRTLIAQLEAVLTPLLEADVLTGFEVVVPLLALLDKDPATRTAEETQRIHDAEVARLVQVLAALQYAGAVHRISISLKFD